MSCYCSAIVLLLFTCYFAAVLLLSCCFPAVVLPLSCCPAVVLLFLFESVWLVLAGESAGVSDGGELLCGWVFASELPVRSDSQRGLSPGEDRLPVRLASR